jgi:hypothetical protein
VTFADQTSRQSVQRQPPRVQPPGVCFTAGVAEIAKMPVVDLVNPPEAPIGLNSFTRIGPRHRYTRETDAEARRQEALELIAVQQCTRHRKLNSALARDGRGGRFSLCGLRACPHCGPLLPPEEPEEEKAAPCDVRDLRADSKAKHGVPGKRGICRVCGKPCSSKRWLYCSTECKAEARKQRKVRLCACGEPIPEGSRKDRRYCTEECRQRAYRKRRRERSSYLPAGVA